MSWQEVNLEEIKAEIIKDGDTWNTMSLEPSLPLLEKITKIHYKVIGDEILTVIQIQNEREIIKKITTARKCDQLHFCPWKPIGNITLPHTLEKYAPIIEDPEDGKIELLYAYIGDVITRHDPTARGIVKESQKKLMNKTKGRRKRIGSRKGSSRKGPVRKGPVRKGSVRKGSVRKGSVRKRVRG